MKDYLKELVQGSTPLQGRNLTREYLQSRILREFQLAGAMTSLAFHGGTCLRFVYGLPRYSEDLDFALEGNKPDYDLETYLRSTRSQLLRENYHVEMLISQVQPVHRGLIRFPGILHELNLSPGTTETLNIRVEVDTNPSSGARTEVRTSRRHTFLRLFCHDRPSLLAGKIHAILWRPFAKGRDWFDLVWHLTDRDSPSPNIEMLNSALRQSEPPPLTLNEDTWRFSVLRRLQEVDWEAVVDDVSPFLVDSREIDVLNKDELERLLMRN